MGNETESSLDRSVAGISNLLHIKGWTNYHSVRARMLVSLKSRGVLLLISADSRCIIISGFSHLREFPCNLAWGGSMDKSQGTFLHQMEMTV